MLVSNSSHRTVQKSHLEVHVTRGNFVESVHLVDAVIVDEKQQLVESHGHGDSVIFPRSAIKMIQALALVQSGAFEKYQLSLKELAIACASHHAEPEHTEVIINWLAKLGLTENSLVCSPHWPYHEPTAHSLIEKKLKPHRWHNNCSGKHSGILSTCLHCGDSSLEYAHYDHPAQIRMRKILATLGKVSLESAPWGVDGCGIPTVAMPLSSIAVALSHFLRPTEEQKIIIQAIQSHPLMIAGQGSYCSQMVAKTKGDVIVKTGAEGVYVGLSRRQGLAIAVKARDGGTRASRVALATLLKRNNAFSEENLVQLKPHIEPEVVNWEGKIVGKIFVPSIALD